MSDPKRMLTIDERQEALRAAGFGDEVVDEVGRLHALLAPVPDHLIEKTLARLAASGAPAREVDASVPSIADDAPGLSHSMAFAGPTALAAAVQRGRALTFWLTAVAATAVVAVISAFFFGHHQGEQAALLQAEAKVRAAATVPAPAPAAAGSLFRGYVEGHQAPAISPPRTSSAAAAKASSSGAKATAKR